VAEQGRRAAVLGKPIAHSLSPVLHRAAYAELALDWSYEAIECDENALAAVLATRTGWAGFSCTMPLKRAALAIAQDVSPAAAAAGAANTLLPRPEGGWRADNTDVAGLLALLRPVRFASVTVLGAGGTAQAALTALADLGIAQATVLVRDPARTVEVRHTAATTGVDVQVATFARAAAFEADLVISTLPSGAADAFAEHDWHARQTVVDVLYEPWPTALATAALARGARVLRGDQLLLHQAAAQVELMTGLAAPIEAMAAALHAALGDPPS
jgi:shikimate dehydrogenase